MIDKLLKISSVVVFLLIIAASWAEQYTVYPLKRVPISDSRDPFLIADKYPFAECGMSFKATTVDIVWLYIESADGLRGYVKKDDFTTNETLAKKVCQSSEVKEQEEQSSGLPSYIYITKLVKLYDGPNAMGLVIAHGLPGDALPVLDKKEGWFKVRAKDGDIGWVAEQWISLDSSSIKAIAEKRAKIESEKKRKIANLVKEVKKIPASNYKKNLLYYDKLTDLDPDNTLYHEKYLYYYKKSLEHKREAAIIAKRRRKQNELATEDQKAAQGYLLKLLDWSWNQEYGYVTATGRVKNISDQKIRNIEALVTWYDANNTMITYGTSYVEYTTLMPKQETPFKVMEKFNPLMKRAKIEFVINGKRVPWYK